MVIKDKVEKVKNFFSRNGVEVDRITEQGAEVVMPTNLCKDIGAEIKEERNDGTCLCTIRYYKTPDSDIRLLEPLEQFQSKKQPAPPESSRPGGVPLE